MANSVLEPGEYSVEDPVPRYGPVQNAIFKVALGPLILLATAFLCYWLPKAFSAFTTNPTLSKEPVYRLIGSIYIPLIGLIVLVALYYFVSIYREKIMLTNRAILRRNVFSTDRIPFRDIYAVSAEYESFNLNQKARLTSFILGLLLGVNWQLTIEADDNQVLHIRNMTKHHAFALKAKLDAARNESAPL